MTARLRFNGEAADLLTVPHDDGVVLFRVDRRASVKDVFESMGIPHTEVHRILVRGVEVGFDHLMASGDEVDVHPPSPPVDVTVPTRLRPEPLPSAGFLVDENVGRLAVLLRLIGCDAAYDRTWEDEVIAETAAAQGRIVLSRDRALLKRSCIVHGRLVRSVMPRDQLVEIVRLYGLSLDVNRFQRCLRCNGILDPVDKEAIMDRLLPKTKKYYHVFRMCRDCGRIYWAGTHHEKMLRFIRGLDRPADV